MTATRTRTRKKKAAEAAAASNAKVRVEVKLPKKRPVGKWESLAYERAKRDREELPALGYYFDEEEADEIVRLIETEMKHHEGEWAGRPFLLEPFQKFIIREVFGWKREDGTRRYRTAYIEIPRKNGKTELGAAVALILTIADGEPGAQVYSSATKKDQARIVHEAARRMVKQSPALLKHARVLAKNISVPKLGSKFEPLSAESGTLDGLNAHGNIVDELHAHKDRHVFDVVVTSMGARRQPLTFIMTTAGVYDPTTIGWDQHEYALKVLEGIFEDDTFFAFVCAADVGETKEEKDDDWTSPATWWKANPNLGVSLKLETVAEMCARAQRQPSFENTFKRYYLDLWTQQAKRWIQPDKWKACGAAFPEEDFYGRPCFAALDLSSKLDLTAAALLFPPAEEGERYNVLYRFWLPEDVVEESAKSGRLQYAAWAREGFLRTTPGNVIDYEFIKEDLRELADLFQIREVGYDPWNATQIALQLAEDGFVMAEVRQGTKTLSEPSKEFERLIVSGRLRHNRNPVATWCVSNVTTREDPNENIAPDKAKSTGRIDGVTATIMAIERYLRHVAAEPPPPPSVYETRGALVL